MGAGEGEWDGSGSGAASSSPSYASRRSWLCGSSASHSSSTSKPGSSSSATTRPCPAAARWLLPLASAIARLASSCSRARPASPQASMCVLWLVWLECPMLDERSNSESCPSDDERSRGDGRVVSAASSRGLDGRRRGGARGGSVRLDEEDGAEGAECATNGREKFLAEYTCDGTRPALCESAGGGTRSSIGGSTRAGRVGADAARAWRGAAGTVVTSDQSAESCGFCRKASVVGEGGPMRTMGMVAPESRTSTGAGGLSDRRGGGGGGPSET